MLALPAITGAPLSSRRLRWMWQELPSRSSYLAMKVRLTPSWAAISLAPVLYTAWSSQVTSASPYLKAISCWPRLHSPFADSTVSPAPVISFRIRRSSSSTLAVPRTE